jgi:hypothetical protein
MTAADNKARLLSEMDTLMRSLRQCDTQATAIAWMTRAYNAMDGATRLIGDLERMVREEASEQRGLISQVARPKLEIVQTIPKDIAHRVVHNKPPNYQRGNGQTVVYPEFFLHPGLKPAPRAWTREDTRRLEAAAKMPPRRIVKQGR